jgi:hypothetical protein
MASFFGSNASLASAVPSGSIIHGRSNGTTEASWNIAGTSDSLTVPSGKMGLIMNYCENGISNSASWSAATQSTSSRRLGMRVGNTSPLTLTITPDIADVTGGIAVVISS